VFCLWILCIGDQDIGRGGEGYLLGTQVVLSVLHSLRWGIKRI